MKKYRIGLVQTVIEETTIFLAAENPEEAETKALHIANQHAELIEWKYLDVIDDSVEVASIDEDDISDDLLIEPDEDEA